MDREILRVGLEAHPCEDSLESAHRARMLELLSSEGDPFSRHHFEPGHFTASAFVLSPDGMHLLLIYHAKLKLWLQPGGHVDAADENIVAAACREAEEETGIRDYDLDSDVPGFLDLDIHGIPPNPKKGEPAHEHFDVRVLLRTRSEVIHAGSDALDAKWVPIADVEGIATDESVMRAVRKLRTRGR